MVDRTLTSQICNPKRMYTPDDLVALDQADDPWLAWAHFYLSVGFPVIPICGPSCPGGDAHFGHEPEKAGKVPLLDGWQKYANKHPTPDQVRKWREKHPGCNLGIPMGGLAGLLAIDVDDQFGRDVLADILGGSELPTLGVRTGGGGDHWLLRWPEGERPPTRHIYTPGKPLSFQGWGGQQVVPPSMHLSGKPYTRVCDWHNGLDAVAPVPDQLYDYLVATAGKKGLTEGVLGPVPAPVRPDTRLEKRARTYLAKCDGAISGQKGDSKTFRVLSGLLRAVGLTRGEALWAFMEFYNSTCSPVWELPEVARKLTYLDENPAAREAPPSRSTGSGLRGGRRGVIKTTAHRTELSNPAGGSGELVGDQADGHQAGHTPHPHANGTPKPDSNGGCITPNGKSDSKGPEKLPGRQLADVECGSFEFFDEPYITRGMVTGLVGPPGVGKTHFLSRLVTLARHTIYFAGEEDVERIVAPRLKALGVKDDRVRIITPDDGWTFPARCDDLLKLVGRWGTDLVVFDSIDDFTDDGFEEDKNTPVLDLLKKLQKVARVGGPAIPIVRHPGKQAGNVMVGARTWKRYLRSIVELVADLADPLVRIIRMYKPLGGIVVPQRYYHLVGEPDGYPRFVLGDLVAPELAELVGAVTDPYERRLADRIREFVRGVLANGPLMRTEVLTLTRKEGYADRTVDRATEKWVVSTRAGEGKGHHAVWALPDEGTNKEGEAA